MNYLSLLLSNLKSPWYHWYQGRRLLALAGMGLGMSVTGLFVMLTAGFGLFPLVFALALDHVLIVLIILYLLLRYSLPAYLPLAGIDWFMVKQVLLIAIPGILITRACTLCVVSLAGWPPKTAAEEPGR